MEDLELTTSESQPPSGLEARTPAAPDQQTKRKGLSGRARWFALAGAAFLLCAVCIAIALAMGAKSTFDIAQARAPITEVVRSYMRAMQYKDPEAAYALFSSFARSKVTVGDFEAAYEGNNFSLYQGFQDLSVDSLRFVSGVSTFPDAPQGLVAKVDGKVWYEQGFVGSYVAALQKEGGQWYLLNITNTVPPNKVK